jgi:hypothetical protein
VGQLETPNRRSRLSLLVEIDVHAFHVPLILQVPHDLVKPTVFLLLGLQTREKPAQIAGPLTAFLLVLLNVGQDSFLQL